MYGGDGKGGVASMSCRFQWFCHWEVGQSWEVIVRGRSRWDRQMRNASLFIISEERSRAAEQERLEQERRLAEAQEERRRQKEEERVRFQKVTELLAQQMEGRRQELEKWKAENLERIQVNLYSGPFACLEEGHV